MFRCTTLTAALVVGAAALATPAAATASTPPALPSTGTPLDGAGAGSYAVGQDGECSGRSRYHLSAAPTSDGHVVVTAGVDSNQAGQSWSWRLLDDHERFASGTSATVAPTGAFTVRRRTVNRLGPDAIELRATNPHTGETCHGLVLLPA